jgi:pyruvate,water dikinase
MDALFAPLEKEDFTTWTWERLLGLLRLEAAGGLRAALVGLSPANPLARGAATPFHSAVEWMVRHWAGGTRETAGALVSGLAGLVEVECAEALWDLAQQAREAPAVARALEADPAGVLEALSDVPEAAAWRAAFRAFLDRFGHRAIEEVEMARPRWRERPAYPLSVIAGYLRCPGERSPRVVEARRRAEREAAETAVGARLRFRPLRRLVFRLALRVAQAAGPAGENTKFHIVRLLTLWRQAALEMGRRLMAEDRLERAEDVFFLRLEELARPKGDFRDRVAARSADLRRWQREDPPRLIDAEGRAVLEGMREAQAPALETDTLSGIGSSAGRARGRVRVVRDPSGGVELEPGEVLVAPYTDPAWTPLFLTACAVVVETGSLLSHASIVARELGVPCVVGVAGATRLLRDGVEVEVDASRGVVRRLAARRDPPTPGGST